MSGSPQRSLTAENCSLKLLGILFCLCLIDDDLPKENHQMSERRQSTVGGFEDCAFSGSLLRFFADAFGPPVNISNLFVKSFY